MAKLSKGDVEHVAKLAKLNLTPKEIEKFGSQVSEVVNYVSELEEVDTKNIAPTSQTTGLENVFRIDEAKNEECLTAEEALSGTSNKHNRYFVVSAILEERDDK